MAAEGQPDARENKHEEQMRKVRILKTRPKPHDLAQKGGFLFTVYT